VTLGVIMTMFVVSLVKPESALPSNDRRSGVAEGDGRLEERRASLAS